MHHPKRIAVVGSGISGLVAAWLLSRRHQVTVFEANDYIGGHTATKTVSWEGTTQDIDTGFIVFNDRTYPNFIKLLGQLGVESQKTLMGFSVSCRDTGYEYSGTSVNGLFAQRKNLFKRDHWKMLQEILRFNRDCTRAYQQNTVDPHETLGEYLQRCSYSQAFQRYYILPMVAAIWSSGLSTAAAMPLLFFIRFFHNHGLLTVTDQAQWYTLCGGSKSYLEPLTRDYAESIYTRCPVTRILRTESGVKITTERFGTQEFDEVILACHSDQALQLLGDASVDEQVILSAIPYSSNKVILHTDTSLLPSSPRAWASWNYRLQSSGADYPILTYHMNILQRLSCEPVFCVTVNPPDSLDARKILGSYDYSHPVFTLASVSAQARWADISGKRHTHFCGAYWRNGFHEDGVVSGLRVAAALGEAF